MENGCISRQFECALLSPLIGLCTTNKNPDVNIGALKILLHVLEVKLFNLTETLFLWSFFDLTSPFGSL